MTKFKIYFPILAVVGIAGWWLLSSKKEILFGAQEMPTKQEFWVIAYGYVITVLAVILGSAYRELQRLRELGETQIKDLKLFFKKIFTSIDFWMGLLGSPIVYALLWKSLDGGSVAGLTVIALQNGFCCTVILSNFVNRQSQPQPAPGPTVTKKP